ncbi:54S ribosomal L24, mitochondrial [Lecanosticta acicola]|uniref:54S ribosomal L24, mitochondrial n=1 Tax=Lecanosticta acicola TaxID=111012 RepID=A0AAI9EA61_9PEZI|nr:54S ribosomal L24, mitochondrial [Lecanosticta acicola]
MADVATTTGADGPEGETPTQRQARLRREKRQKKMAEQGEDRLNKIKALNGGVAPPDEVLGGPGTQGPQAASVADDPDEVDISQYSNFSTNASDRSAQAQGDPLAAAMMQMEQEQRQAGGQGQREGQEDPMVKMMQQMMGAMGGDPNDPNAKAPDVPPWMASMLSGGGQKSEQPRAPTTGAAYLWRIVHAIFAFGLAFYICLTSTFNGSKLARSQSVYTEEAGYGLGPRLFLIFTSAELLLQSTRYFMEKGQLQGAGMFAMVANSGFVPEPYANYIRVGGRYIAIAQTIFTDVMVIVFVLGCMAWWNGVATMA